MDKFRLYGQKPFKIAVLHGGPGAAGEMAPVARELAVNSGIIEPLQTAMSIDGQVEELHDTLKTNAELPVTLIGHSWGAWLGFIFAARYPALIARLILVSSGPFEDKYAVNIMATRLSRLDEKEKTKALSIIATLENPATKDKNTLLARFGRLMSKADSYDPLPEDGEFVECDFAIYQKVWAEASEMRHSGKLLKLGRKIKCPAVAIHGDYDPHPAAGIKEPLSQTIKNFHFILLEHCGHKPWVEKEARDEFYRILTSQIK
jgi:pimeloyl-ACP methyl ester carboxylesterase